MRAKKAIKELEKQLRKEPENLVLRLKLAASYRDLGNTSRAVEIYRDVAVSYEGSGRLGQAIAVCKSILEIVPNHKHTQDLLTRLDREKSARGTEPEQPAPRPELRAGFFNPDEAHRSTPPAAPGDLGPGEPLPSLAAAVPPAPPPSPLPAGRSLPPVEFGRSGMTPARPSPPPRARRSSRRMATPLPEPLALHDEPAARPSGAPAATGEPAHAPAPPSSAPQRGAQPRRAASPYRQTLRGPLEPRFPGGRLPGPAELAAMREVETRPRPGSVAPAPVVTEAPDDDEATRLAPDPAQPVGDFAEDDAMTRVAGDNLFPGGFGGETQELDASELLMAEDGALDALLVDIDGDPEVPAAPRGDGPVDERPTRVADVAGWPAGVPRRPDPEATRPAAAVAGGGAHEALDAETGRFPGGGVRRVTGADAVAAAVEGPTQRVRRVPRPEELALPDDDVPPAEDDEDDADTGAFEIDIGPDTGELAVGASGGRRSPRDTLETFEPPAHRGRAGSASRASSAGVERPTLELDDGAEPAAAPAHTQTTRVRPMRTSLPGEEDHGLELAAAFDKSFAETLRALAPEGSTIEAPLSIFSDMPDDALTELSQRMQLRSFGPEQLVVREGDPGDACYVVASGEVAVLKQNPHNPAGGLVEVARLGPGSLFGEFALLADRRRHATVRAIGAADVYEIPRRVLRELAATFPEVGPLLETFYRERLLSTLLGTAPFFRPISEERRADLLARFRPVRRESGQLIIREGERAGGLYLIVLGTVEITKRVSDRRQALLATLGEGSYFGEMSLLRGRPASASVIAAGPTELAILPPRDFYQIVSENPVLWDEVRREAHRRELEQSQLLTGETHVV